MCCTQITDEELKGKKFIQVPDGSWRKCLFEKTFLSLCYQNEKWIAELCLIGEEDLIIDSKQIEFDGKTVEHLNYAGERFTGDTFI